tara:strand:+ start:4872 stop:5081 length:210 start_codon:yes stop_codon:yes gene_type:complete
MMIYLRLISIISGRNPREFRSLAASTNFWKVSFSHFVISNLIPLSPKSIFRIYEVPEDRHPKINPVAIL